MCGKQRKKRAIGDVESRRNEIKKKNKNRVNTSQGGAESLHLLFSVWNSHYTYPLSLKGAPLSTPLKSLGTNATPEYYPN